MNTQNLDYLKKSLKYLGFGNALSEDLEKKIHAQDPGFQLNAHMSYHKSAVDYTLHFRKSDQSNMYFLNKYEAHYRNMDPKQDKNQTFYINKNSGITAKEAYNLLEGRTVHKELVNAENQHYKAWLQLDTGTKGPSGNYKIRQFHENYGYDLEKTLQQFHIKELQDPQQKEQLLYSLRKGNQQLVTAFEEGYEVKRFVEASPQFKTINVYNEQRHLAMRETIQRYEVRPEKSINQQSIPDGQTSTLEKQMERRQSQRHRLTM